ncbi:MAG: Eco57I restriction-modification methylase domain-containing protein [Candidatus Dormibacteria bacterium]
MPLSEAIVHPAHLKAVRSLPDALELMSNLGYETQARPVDVSVLNLPGLARAHVIRNSGSRRTGYGVLVGEAAELPRSLRPLARSIQREVHDQPLAVVGVGNGAAWERLVIFRPRQVGGQLGAVTVSRLDVDLSHPTQHDAEVVSGLRWRGQKSDAQAQDALNEALSVEAVTNRFYRGLKPHFEALDAAVDALAARRLAVAEGIQIAGGHRRVAIRVLTQILFCYFLQRKHLLAGERDYLTSAFSQRSGPFYPTVLEPLFYDTLAVPETQRAASALTASIPFLNGGLFERRYGDMSLDLPDQLFDLDAGLLGYLNHWTFTVAEETADEVEVAVDPEMLGRIFESLLPDAEREQKGTYYTPRPVVQFMCREALVGRLASAEMPEDALRTLLCEEDPFTRLREAGHAEESMGLMLRELDQSLARITVLDPAVGSGAFPLGMLGEIIRLRGIAYEAFHGSPASAAEIHAWKLQAIEQSLFGVDIEPIAVELCRLRLWLSLIVELDASHPVPPLPNLEYRTVCADSLVDFVEGIPIQDTRREGQASLFTGVDADEVVRLRAEYFQAADPAVKAELRGRLMDAENVLLNEWLEGAQAQLRQRPTAQARLDALKAQLRSPDRVYPVFMPGFSAPEVWTEGGWDIVIMNPPYVGRKEIPQRYGEPVIDALVQHYGQTHDLMILFAERAFQLARPGGMVSMIFNDSIFTSTDANEFRRHLFDQAAVNAMARTKCFEGQAVNGGVIVARKGLETTRPVRWVEGYQRPVQDFAAASAALDTPAGSAEVVEAAAGSMEVFSAPRDIFLTLPHRPLYRPSKAAVALSGRFSKTAEWATFRELAGWELLSNTRALEHAIADRRKSGFYQGLKPGEWVLLGLVTEGGQGLATADDRRFLAAVEDTAAAQEHLEFQERLEKLTLQHAVFGAEYQSLLRTHGDREAALLALWSVHGAKRPVPLPWPRTGTFRIATSADLRQKPLSREEGEHGIASGPFWVPFEKGDQSQELEGDDGHTSRIGSAWTRDNPLVIDWSREAVGLLRRRAASKESAQKPYFRNEHLWFHTGVTWNSLASYLRARNVPETAIFGHMSPLLRPLAWVEWMSPAALLSLLNSDVLDFVLRTFLGSRMHIEVGDIRRLIVPVLTPDQKDALEAFANRATAAKRAQDRRESGERLVTVEHELDVYVRDLYGISSNADLWVVR